MRQRANERTGSPCAARISVSGLRPCSSLTARPTSPKFSAALLNGGSATASINCQLPNTTSPLDKMGKSDEDPNSNDARYRDRVRASAQQASIASASSSTVQSHGPSIRVVQNLSRLVLVCTGLGIVLNERDFDLPGQWVELDRSECIQKPP